MRPHPNGMSNVCFIAFSSDSVFHLILFFPSFFFCNTSHECQFFNSFSLLNATVWMTDTAATAQADAATVASPVGPGALGRASRAAEGRPRALPPSQCLTSGPEPRVFAPPP